MQYIICALTWGFNEKNVAPWHECRLCQETLVIHPKTLLIHYGTCAPLGFLLEELVVSHNPKQAWVYMFTVVPLEDLCYSLVLHLTEVTMEGRVFGWYMGNFKPFDSRQMSITIGKNLTSHVSHFHILIIQPILPQSWLLKRGLTKYWSQSIEQDLFDYNLILHDHYRSRITDGIKAYLQWLQTFGST